MTPPISSPLQSLAGAPPPVRAAPTPAAKLRLQPPQANGGAGTRAGPDTRALGSGNGTRARLGVFAVACAATLRARLRRRPRGHQRSPRAAAGAGTAVAKKPFTAGGLFSPLAFAQWTDWATELGAGLTTAVVALPLAMAFGVASGVGPLAGLYGAIFTGFFAAFLGGTPAQVTGPTGPMTVIMAAVLAKYGDPAIAFTCVALSGLIQIALGFLRVGGLIRLVPVTVLSGFMTGIGGIICSLQLPVLFGYSGGGKVLESWLVMPRAITAPNLPALAIGLFTLFTLYKLPDRFTFKIPRPLLALVGAATATATILPALGISVPTLGAIPQGLPVLQLPVITPSLIGPVLSTSLALATLGAIDSLLTSLVSDSMTSSFHDSNRELIGQGVGNTVAGIFGGNAGAGATMRTVVNVRTGGRTPVSGGFHSICLLIFVLGLGPLARYVPVSCLAGILIKSGLDVVDWPLLRRLNKIPKTETAIMVVTCYMTIFVDLIVAVAVGWVLAIFKHFYTSSMLQLGPKGVTVESSGELSVVRLRGQVAFGAAVGLLRELVPQVVGKKAVVLDLSEVTLMDSSAVLAWEELIEKIKAAGGQAFVCGLQPDAEGAATLEKLGLAVQAENASATDAVEDVTAAAREAATQG